MTDINDVVVKLRADTSGLRTTAHRWAEEYTGPNNTYLQLAGQPVTDNIDVTAVLAATVALQASGGDKERAERRVKAALPPGAVRTAILEQLKGVNE